MTNKTSKPVFKKLKRFDADKAAKGFAHHIEDENGNDYGTWTTRFFDVHNKALKVENDRYERQHGNDAQAKGKHAGVYAFVNVCLTGWEGVLDENDQPIPYSAELAFEYLTDEENGWFTNELIERSKDARYYRAVTPLAVKEEDAGN